MRRSRNSFPWDEREAALWCGLSACRSSGATSEVARCGLSGKQVATIPCAGHARDHLKSANDPSYALTNQQAVSITVEAVARVDSVLVGRKDVLAAGESADQRQQRGTRQMKVCEQPFHGTKPESGHDKQARFCVAGKHEIRGV